MLAAAIVFGVTYLLIGLQRLPRIHIGRPAGALLGAVGMVAFGVLSFADAKAAVDLDTILFLLGMMIVLGYIELSGFFDLIERRIIGWAASPRALLILVLGSSATLSALFMNDTVCLMLTPVVLRVTRRLELPPAPYLIATAVAANIGSVCTIVGNPQNALIGVRSGIGLLSFVTRLWPASAVGLALAAAILVWTYRRQITGRTLVVPPPRATPAPQRWMLVASLASGLGMMVALSLGVNPAAAAMAAAAAAILAGAARPRFALQRVDWSLLLLFGGLFVVMRGVERAGLGPWLIHGVAGPLAAGGAVEQGRLALGALVLSQAVSNVPAVMLFVPPLESLSAAAAKPLWLGLAAYSTLAGNLTILASMANLIVVETARREGVEIGFVEHLRVGLPITLVTLAAAWTLLSR